MTLSSSDIWSVTYPEATAYPSLTKTDLDFDVLVIGGGITGLSTAYRLQLEGRSVAVLERDRLLSGETGKTTAQLTSIVDARYAKLIKDFGADPARLVWKSNTDAIDRIEATVRTLGDDCSFERLPAYVYSEDEAGIDGIEAEHRAMRELGFEVKHQGRAPLPFNTRAAIRIENQAQIHPRRYLDALAHRFIELGGQIFEHSLVRQVKDGSPCEVHTDLARITANEVVVATDVPVSNKLFLITKLPAYRSYVVALKLRPGDENRAPRGLFFDTQDPYHYTRGFVDRGDEFVIVGGSDHKVGMGDPELAFADLIEYCRKRWDVAAIPYRWSGEIIEPVDGLPYIGLNSASRHVYVATGYSGNGWTYGTIAADLITDLIQGRTNPYADLYSAHRIKPIAGAAAYLSENKDFPLCFLSDRMQSLKDAVRAPEKTVNDLAPGEGAILSVEGKAAAVYRDDEGRLHAVSATCTHLGCHVRFNAAESSWDCPCHGARFSTDGDVLHGPACKPLEAVDIGKLEGQEANRIVPPAPPPSELVY